MWEEILKSGNRVSMRDKIKVYDYLIDGKQRTLGEIAKDNDMSISKVLWVMKKLIGQKERYPNIKKVKGEHLYYREVYHK